MIGWCTLGSTFYYLLLLFYLLGGFLIFVDIFKQIYLIYINWLFTSLTLIIKLSIYYHLLFKYSLLFINYFIIILFSRKVFFLLIIVFIFIVIVYNNFADFLLKKELTLFVYNMFIFMFYNWHEILFFMLI